uniref:Large ribosomal subunit protein bL9c n=1 Tax=Gracilariopsis longissima TaxID=172976 RepID=A0A345U9U0_9FLOR|nr:ribosomal protein L9 [Gracilariopsis longissima]AXI97226.1 ribosomal protein L9 [Gracilariopsis longissima]UAD89142.1 ribosomal protein L9 [Gracilariopsis longissima]
MKKKTTVILKKNFVNLGQMGNIVKVNLGYALNYLIPNNIAEIATIGKLRHYEMFLDIKNKKLNEIDNKMKVIQQKLNQITKISLKKKSGSNSQIFGSVSDKDIILSILYCTQEKLDKKNIYLPSIKKLGIYNINIILSSDIKVQLKLQILPMYI